MPGYVRQNVSAPRVILQIELTTNTQTPLCAFHSICRWKKPRSIGIKCVKFSIVIVALKINNFWIQ